MKRLILGAALCALSVLPAAADALPGYDRFDLRAEHRARPLAASIWYPAATPTYRVPIGDGPIFEPTSAFMGPAVARGRHPLVLLTHGSGGNADTLGWLSSGLVARGAIVLAVNHPGSTSGDSSPRRSAALDLRAGDLGAALDTVLADPSFAPFVDSRRISVVGFSLGGATALGLAGVRFDAEAQDEHCRERPEAGDCAFFLKGGVAFRDHPGFGANTRERRVALAVVIDPAFGTAATPDSVTGVRIPVHFINLGRAHRIPAGDVGPDGNNLAGRMPGATYSVIAPAHHFTFLARCKPKAADLLAEEGEDPICSDPEGADRDDVHARLIDDIAQALGL